MPCLDPVLHLYLEPRPTKGTEARTRPWPWQSLAPGRVENWETQSGPAGVRWVASRAAGPHCEQIQSLQMSWVGAHVFPLHPKLLRAPHLTYRPLWAPTAALSLEESLRLLTFPGRSCGRLPDLPGRPRMVTLQGDPRPTALWSTAALSDPF